MSAMRTTACLLLLGLLALARAAGAQAPAGGPPPDGIEAEPIRCWWRTDTVEVRIGERFGVTLTCAVIDTRSLKVVPSTNSLDPGAIQLTPFEVVSGVRHDDILAPPRRYFQYEYRVRLLSEGFFGQDVSIPGLTVTYAIQASDGGTQGREQRYLLPALPIRVASLVPKEATDIREPPAASFAAIDGRRFRATTATVAGSVLIGLGGVVLVLGAVHALGGLRRRAAVVRPLRPAVALNGCLRALARVKADASRDGWSPALVRRALAVLRVGGALGLGRPVAQTMVSRDSEEREGQLRIRHGVVRRRWTLVSGATTAAAIDRALAGAQRMSPATRSALERLRGSLQALGAAAYGRATDFDTVALDAALAEGTDAIRQLRRQSVWPIGMPSRKTADAPATLRAAMGEERL